MTIRREDLKHMDFSDVATGEMLPSIHPGQILLEEFLLPLKITQYRLAKEIHVQPTRISEIIKGHRNISVDTAMRLSRYFGNSAEFWLGLQMTYDLQNTLLKVDIKPLAA